ncbi:MAG: nicotinate-nicotinamide nucleotide adenylyltransferase [Alphaproteobacteria bacterium]|nr:nicotinate-nicotinamide nucleotide adenylyltransferase [Alphaproteobacteria bacterium]
MPLFTPPTLLNAPRWKNMRIGLLGGSFNPPHEGHLHISLSALKGLALDAIWWLVTPQNPLKTEAPLPFEDRMALCRIITAQHPRLLTSGLEKELGTPFTRETARALKKAYPDTDFVWIAGMDNALTLHQWNAWRDLLNEICILCVTRPPALSLVQNSPFRMYGREKHVTLRHAGKKPLDSGTAYWMLDKKMLDISSTKIRENTLKSNN